MKRKLLLGALVILVILAIVFLFACSASKETYLLGFDTIFTTQTETQTDKMNRMMDLVNLFVSIGFEFAPYCWDPNNYCKPTYTGDLYAYSNWNKRIPACQGTSGTQNCYCYGQWSDPVMCKQDWNNIKNGVDRAVPA